MTNPYGYSLTLDIKECDSDRVSREDITQYLAMLCTAIDMEREDLHFWDYEDDPEGYQAAPVHLRGVSAVQFIKTSSLVIHTLDDLKLVFVDLFSCKKFEPRLVLQLSESFFRGKVVNSLFFERGQRC